MAIHRGRDVYKYTYEYKYFLTDGKETWDRPTVCWRTTFDD